MIISRTPLRISFVGGGSDLSDFSQHEPGAVVTTAIDKYIYITTNRKFDNRVRVSYSVTEIVDSVAAIKHELVRAALELTELDGGIEITSISDIPSQGTGLGSSSTYTVGLLNALYAFKGQHAGAERLAAEACHIEIDICGKPIGKQDQYIAAYGGLQYIQFNPDNTVEVEPIICRPETKKQLQSHLLMLYTGITRPAALVLQEQKANVQMQPETRLVLRKLVNLACDFRDALRHNKVLPVGEILHQGWLEKRRLASGITNAVIDDWYARARKAGALGGKILGAGGGGFLLLFAPPKDHPRIIAALPELRQFPFRFEPHGSRIIFIEEHQN